MIIKIHDYKKNYINMLKKEKNSIRVNQNKNIYAIMYVFVYFFVYFLNLNNMMIKNYAKIKWNILIFFTFFLKKTK